MTDEREILVAGPYIGELGWELFSWQPMVRKAFLSGRYDKCVAFTSPGRRRLYPWADVRTLDNMPEHESECLAWHELGKHKKELEELMDRMLTVSLQEFGDRVKALSYNSLPAFNQPFYERGLPDLILPRLSEDDVVRKWQLPDGKQKRIALCVRDRAMTEERNWGFENWVRLAWDLSKEYDVVLLGKTREAAPLSGTEKNMRDLTNGTTIDDCVDLLSICDLAVGGSSGLLHLASRMGIDHLAWGTDKNAIRFAETNWFGADYDVLTFHGWKPPVEEIFYLACDMLEEENEE